MLGNKQYVAKHISVIAFFLYSRLRNTDCLKYSSFTGLCSRKKEIMEKGGVEHTDCISTS